MEQRILYSHPGSDGVPAGTLAVVIPTGEAPIEVTARKDVPQGIPYKIVDLADIEDAISDRTFRSAWEADFTDPDGTGDPDGYWAEKAAEEAARLAAEAERLAARQNAQEVEQ
jgi:hypothetical protein